MKLANCKTMSLFLRKCVLEKDIYIVDLEPFRNLQWLLSNATNNIKQIAKVIKKFGKLNDDETDILIYILEIYEEIKKEKSPYYKE